jgi:UDP-glucose 4-epimerase
MRIVVTGSTGYIGGVIMRRAIAAGHEVIGLGKSTYIDPVRPDVVIHAGWHGVRLGREAPSQAENIVSVMQAVAHAKVARAKLWIGLGSQAEIQPTNAYGYAKRAAGIVAEGTGVGLNMPVTWARLFSVYGPHDPGPSLIHDTISSFRRGLQPAYDACTQDWDFLYEDDAADALLALCTAPAGRYDIASGVRVPLVEVPAVLKEILISTAPRNLHFDRRRTGATLAKAVPTFFPPNWSPKVSLYEGLRRTVEQQP